jgi:hypothetical protein
LKEATSVISGLAVEPTSPPSMNVIVRAGTAVINGSPVSLGSDTTVSISTPDPSYPRFDLITLKSTGVVGYYTGTPEAAVAVDLAKPETYVKPKPPSTPVGEVALAEVFVPAGATAIDKILDRRIMTGLHASQITSGRLSLSRMPDGPSGYVLTAKGVGVDPSFDAPSVDAGALEDSYISLFKAKDPRVARLLEHAELLYSAGKLTADDVAGFISDVLVYVPTIAYAFERFFTTSFLAAVLNSASFSASKAASIVNDANLSVSKAATIFNDANLSASRAVSILKDANITADRAQAILYSMADQSFFDKLMAIIVDEASDYSVTASTTLTTGVNRYGTLSISSDVTLTLGASPGVIIAGTVNNSGTIVSGWVNGAGGSAGASGAGAGGAGRGAVIILARSITIGTITANGATGGNGSTVTANGPGSFGGAGGFWLISGDSVPSGGNGGGAQGGTGRPNGGGGGGYSYAAGAGGSATTTTYADGPSLLKQLFKSICDWWLVNVAGRNPTSTVSIPSLGGSGGGGGGAYDGYCAGGGGGGGGGQIIVYGTSVTAGTVQVKGGVGGNGGTEGSYDCGGGGGGGGIIYVFYKSLTGTFTYDVSGGAGGTGDYSGYAGGTGVFRVIAV